MLRKREKKASEIREKSSASDVEVQAFIIIFVQLRRQRKTYRHLDRTKIEESLPLKPVAIIQCCHGDRVPNYDVISAHYFPRQPDSRVSESFAYVFFFIVGSEALL